MRAATTNKVGPRPRATRRPPGRADSHKNWTDQRGLVTSRNAQATAQQADKKYSAAAFQDSVNRFVDAFTAMFPPAGRSHSGSGGSSGFNNELFGLLTSPAQRAADAVKNYVRDTAYAFTSVNGAKDYGKGTGIGFLKGLYDLATAGQRADGKYVAPLTFSCGSRACQAGDTAGKIDFFALTLAGSLAFGGVGALADTSDAAPTIADLLEQGANGASDTAPDLGALAATGQRRVGDTTRVAQELQKHQGGLFPTVTRGVDPNVEGQRILGEILDNPDTQIGPVTTGHFKGGTRFIDPTGRGATFDRDNNFRYFAEYP